MALAEATMAGCMMADPLAPPTAAIIVSSRGKSPCMPSLMRDTEEEHPFRRAQDGDHHPIDPKTGDYTDGYHE